MQEVTKRVRAGKQEFDVKYHDPDGTRDGLFEFYKSRDPKLSDEAIWQAIYDAASAAIVSNLLQAKKTPVRDAKTKEDRTKAIADLREYALKGTPYTGGRCAGPTQKVIKDAVKAAQQGEITVAELTKLLGIEQ